MHCIKILNCFSELNWIFVSLKQFLYSSDYRKRLWCLQHKYSLLIQFIFTFWSNQCCYLCLHIYLCKAGNRRSRENPYQKLHAALIYIIVHLALYTAIIHIIHLMIQYKGWLRLYFSCFMQVTTEHSSLLWAEMTFLVLLGPLTPSQILIFDHCESYP